MKRLFILASAAALMLASCTKTTVVYNEAPEEIGFKAVTGVMTKTPLGDQGHTTMGVFANYNDGKGVYFDDAQFNEGTEWVGAPSQYWPLTGDLDFAFYAPYAATAASRTYTVDPAKNTLTIKVDNSSAEQVDWLYGATMTTGNKATPIATVSPTMKHLLAKITINITGNESVKINEITLTSTEQTEDATIDYADAGNVEWTTVNNNEVNWGFLSRTDPVTPAFNLSDVKKTFTCYVIPSAQTSFLLDYSISGVEAPDHDHDIDGNWDAGKAYVYDITVNPGEIKFTPTVTEWNYDLDGDSSLDPDDDNIPVDIK